MKKKIIIVILLISLIDWVIPGRITYGSSFTQSSPIWPMFRYNTQHTGRCPYDTSKNNGTLKWKYKAGRIITSSPAIGSDGTIYVGSWDDYLYAFNPNGTLKWKYETGGGDSSPAIGSDGTIYIGSDGLCAINPDGTLKWKYEMGDWVRSSPAISSDGTIYVGSNDGYFYAINPDGTLKWKYQTDYIFSSPAISSDGTIYVGSEDCCLHAFSPNGTLKWKYKTGDHIYSSPAISSDGTIYVGSYDGYFYAINPDGTLKWKYGVADGDSSPAIGSDGTIYIGSHSGLYAINPDGTLKWEYKTNCWVVSSPAIGSDGTIYVGSCDGLYAINPDGTLKWKYKTGDWVKSSPAIGSDGTIYVGSLDHYLYAIGTSITSPAVSTNPYSITPTSVVLNGNLTDMGGDSSVTVYFEWGTDRNYGYETTHETMNATGTFNAKLTNLSPNTMYHYRAVATNSVETSYGDDKTFTTPSSFSSPTPPTAPSNLTATSLDNKITLNWTASTQNTYPIAGYAIYKGTEPGKEDFSKPIATVEADKTEYTDKNVEIGKTYYYVVKAFDNQNPPSYSEPSNEIKVKIEDTIPPVITITSPEDNYTTDTNTITITGTAVDKETGIDTLTINGNNVSVSSDNSFSYTVNLTEGTNTINIVATDKAGNKTTTALTITYAPPVKTTVITLQPNNPYMTVNGVKHEIDPGRGTKPVIIPKWGRTVVPIRAIVEALGGTIGWDGTERKVTVNFNGTTIELWIGKPQARVNREMKWIDPNNHDVKPIIVNGRTMLPLRFVVENLGCSVDWDPVTKTITIIYTSSQ